eukprot:scaffold80477_cov71-Phaeocystis_antarctica.AAC.6
MLRAPRCSRCTAAAQLARDWGDTRDALSRHVLAAVGALEPDSTACTLPHPPPLLPRAHEGAESLRGSCASAGPRAVLVQHVRPLWPCRKHSVTHTRGHVLGRFAAHEARPALFALHGA